MKEAIQTHHHEQSDAQIQVDFHISRLVQRRTDVWSNITEGRRPDNKLSMPEVFVSSCLVWYFLRRVPWPIGWRVNVNMAKRTRDAAVRFVELCRQFSLDRRPWQKMEATRWVTCLLAMLVSVAMIDNYLSRLPRWPMISQRVVNGDWSGSYS